MIFHNQRLKKSVPGVPNWAQCFYCSVVMLVSHYKPIEYETYFDDAEVLYGKRGIGEESMQKHNFTLVAKDGSRVRSGQFWAVHCDAANKYLPQGKKAVWSEIDWQAFRAKLTKGPCVLGTKIPPSDGHIIVVLGWDGSNYICNDPYGNGKNGYADPNGELVAYDCKWLESVASFNGKARAMWVEST